MLVPPPPRFLCCRSPLSLAFHTELPLRVMNLTESPKPEGYYRIRNNRKLQYCCSYKSAEKMWTSIGEVAGSNLLGRDTRYPGSSWFSASPYNYEPGLRLYQAPNRFLSNPFQFIY